MSNHTQSGQPYEEYFGESAPLDLPLYNNGGPSTVKMHVKEEGTPDAQFYTIQVDVEDAQEVTLVLKDENDNDVLTITVLLFKPTTLTPCLPMSSADNLGKQIGPRSGPGLILVQTV